MPGHSFSGQPVATGWRPWRHTPCGSHRSGAGTGLVRPRSRPKLFFLLPQSSRSGIRGRHAGAAGYSPAGFKGPGGAARHYNPAFLRMPSGDLDFAVRECEIEEACSALKEAGYSLESPLRVATGIQPPCDAASPLPDAPRTAFPPDPRTARATGGQVLRSGRVIPAPQRNRSADTRGRQRDCSSGVARGIRTIQPFFHLYELRRICKLHDVAVRREAAAMAAEAHFAGVFALIDVAFQSRWGEPFLPPDTTMPRTWLDWRIDDTFYQRYDRWSELDGAHTLRTRLLGRWLDLQTTDSPLHAARQVATLTHLGWHELWRRGWRDVPLGRKRSI